MCWLIVKSQGLELNSSSLIVNLKGVRVNMQCHTVYCKRENFKPNYENNFSFNGTTFLDRFFVRTGKFSLIQYSNIVMKSFRILSSRTIGILQMIVKYSLISSLRTMESTLISLKSSQRTVIVCLVT